MITKPPHEKRRSQVLVADLLIQVPNENRDVRMLAVVKVRPGPVRDPAAMPAAADADADETAGGCLTRICAAMLAEGDAAVPACAHSAAVLDFMRG